MQRQDHSAPLPCASQNMTSNPPNLSLLTALMAREPIALNGGTSAVPELTQGNLALGSEELTQQLLAMVSAQLSYLQLSQQAQQLGAANNVSSVDFVRHTTPPVRVHKTCWHRARTLVSCVSWPTWGVPTSNDTFLNRQSLSPSRRCHQQPWRTRTRPRSTNGRDVATAGVAIGLQASLAKARSELRDGQTRRGTPRPRCLGQPRALACLFPGSPQWSQRPSTALQVCWAPTCCQASSAPPHHPTPRVPNQPPSPPPSPPPSRPQPACLANSRGHLPIATRLSCRAWRSCSAVPQCLDPLLDPRRCV